MLPTKCTNVSTAVQPTKCMEDLKIILKISTASQKMTYYGAIFVVKVLIRSKSTTDTLKVISFGSMINEVLVL